MIALADSVSVRSRHRYVNIIMSYGRIYVALFKHVEKVWESVKNEWNFHISGLIIYTSCKKF